MDDILKCNCSDCASGLPATLAPSLLIYAPRPFNTPIVAHLTLNICVECSKRMTVDDILTEDGKARLNAGFLKIGKMLPDWSRTKVAFEPIKGRNGYFAEMEQAKMANPNKVIKA